MSAEFDKRPAEPTKYVVLRRADDRGVWEIAVLTISGRSANEAIRKTAIVNDPGRPIAAGTYVAVPIRSWKPVTVTAEIQTKLKLESA